MCATPGCIWNTAIHVSGHPEISEKLMHGEENRVGASYFNTLGIPILQGRDFDERDLPTSQPVAILSHTFARKLFGNESPIGHRVGYETAPHDADYLVVGEAGDARVDDLRSLPPPVAYFSIDQRPRPAGTVEVRASGQLGVLYSPIRQTLLSVDPHLPITDIVPLNAEYEDGLFKETLLAPLTGAFGLLALALAALGFYGLLSFNIMRRTSEIGIRIAIGATRGDVYTLVLRQTMGILIAGIVPGTERRDWLPVDSNSRGVRVALQSIPSGLSCAPVKIQFSDSSQSLDVALMAGFFGVFQDSRDHSLAKNCLAVVWKDPRAGQTGGEDGELRQALEQLRLESPKTKN
jgi:hypothetical protein